MLCVERLVYKGQQYYSGIITVYDCMDFTLTCKDLETFERVQVTGEDIIKGDYICCVPTTKGGLYVTTLSALQLDIYKLLSKGDVLNVVTYNGCISNLFESRSLGTYTPLGDFELRRGTLNFMIHNLSVHMCNNIPQIVESCLRSEDIGVSMDLLDDMNMLRFRFKTNHLYYQISDINSFNTIKAKVVMLKG